MRRRVFVVTILLHALFLTITYIFQGMIFPHLRLYGYTPLLLPIVSTGAAVYEGRDTGGIVGLFAGILCDISFNEPVGVFTVLLTVMGLIAGALADTVLTRGFASYFVCCAAVLAVSAFAQMFPLLFFSHISPPPLVDAAIRQTAYSLLFAFPLWIFVRALGMRAQRILPSRKRL